MNDIEIKARIAVLRNGKGLSQAQAADAMGVCERAWQNIETGSTHMLYPRLGDIARVLGCTRDYLITGKTRPSGLLEDSSSTEALRARIVTLQKQLEESQAANSMKDKEINKLKEDVSVRQVTINALQDKIDLIHENQDMARRLEEK